MRNEPVKWRAEGRGFQEEETASTKVQGHASIWSVWERKAQKGKRGWVMYSPRKVQSGVGDGVQDTEGGQIL